MKIFIAQQNYHIGNFQLNTEKIIKAINKAEREDGDLIVFSELAISGYPPRDFLEFEEFIEKCNESLEEIKKHTENIAVIVGAPAKNHNIAGKDLFNAAYFIQNQEVKHIYCKALLPNYDVFDEYRYFEPGFEFNCIELQGIKIAITICEDIWDMGENLNYRFRPMDILAKEFPQLMINLSASPFDYTHADDRKYIVCKNATHYNIPIVYCNTVGSQTEIVFDGGSLVADAQGNILKEMPYFEESLEYITLLEGKIQGEIFQASSDLPQQELIPTKLEPELNTHLIHQALVMGIRQYFEKMGFQKAIIASSGGIDSALTIALAAEALGNENIHTLLMPSQFSTGHSVDDAVQLAKNLQVKYDIIAIKDIYDAIDQSLNPIFKDLPFDVTEENIQSRIRGLLVMALANKYHYILLNTSNKSELATGYGTLYGDMAGGLGVLGDLYKTQVYALSQYINREEEIIPRNILEKAPSAELRDGQKDSDSLPDYEVLDGILYQYIEMRQGLEDIVQLGFDRNIVEKTLKLMNKNEYKRNQFCPIIRISAKSFGIGRRLPIVAKYEL